MKPRARRVTMGAAVLGAVLVAVLVAVVVVAVDNWSIVCDHLEAWHFQLTTETETIEPDSGVNEELPGSGRVTRIPRREVLPRMVAESLRCPVICDLRSMAHWVVHCGEPRLIPARNLLSGYRVLEQRFPRRAYVLMRVTNRPVPTKELQNRVEELIHASD